MDKTNGENKPPIDEVQPVMQKLARGIQEELPTGWGFIVMAFPLDDKMGRLNYISNGSRKDVLEMLKQFLYRNRDPQAFNRHSDIINPGDEN